MLAPKITRARTKAISAPMNGLARQSSAMVAHRTDPGRKAVAETSTAREATRGASWNFDRIPSFPPDRRDRSHAPFARAEPAMSGHGLPNLTVGPVDGPLEREADSIADRVIRRPDAAPSVTAAPMKISRKCAGCEEDEKSRKLQTKSAATFQTPVKAPGIVHEVLRSPGRPLDPGVRAFMEPRFGHDFGAIRVHTDPQATRSASAVNALAYTVGHHIVFANDRYAPGTESGKRLLAHELTHAVQQGKAEPSAFGAPLPIGAAHDASVAENRPTPQPLSQLTRATPIGSSPGLSVQRACDQPESFYQTSPNFCRDDTFSTSTHPGKTCYREIIPSMFGCPSGNHCCFAPDGSVEDSYDTTSLASSKDDDGSCNWRWTCVVRHTLTDYLPAVAGQALSPLTCAAQCANSPAPELCTQSCVQQAQAQ